MVFKGSHSQVDNMGHNYVRAKVIFYPPIRGGRVCVPMGDGYAPYLRVASAAGDLAIRVDGLPSNGMFDMEYEVRLELTYHPRISYFNLEEGTRFLLIEGPKVIGEGVVWSAIYYAE